MTYEGDDGSVDIPADMFDEDDEAVLAPVFVGHRMEAELIRSLLEASDIPAVVFGIGGFPFGAEDAGPNERVMVRSDHVAPALEAIRSAEISDGEIVQPTEDDLEILVGEDLDDDFEDQDFDGRESVEVLAGGSDWGPRIVGLLGLVALAVAILVIVAQEA